MTYSEVASMVAEIGVPYAYYQFPDGTGQATPFVCFFYPYNNDVKADGRNYQKVEHLIIELYTDTKDFDIEATVENVLSAHGLVWARSEEWIESERMLEVIFEMDVVITSRKD
jgi:hypothetical protein